jgi:predicted phage terminase large subunit-like protein
MTSLNSGTRIDDARGLLQALLRRDFRYFLAKVVLELTGSPLDWNWHLDAIVARLHDVEQGRCTRLLVTMPPRHLKSLTISVAWVAWCLGRDPRMRFMCISYAMELGEKHARDTRKVMQSDWYRELFPLTRLSSRTALHDFETTAGGGRFATSITGTVTGRGGGIIIIDDPIKPEDAFSDTVRENVTQAYRSTIATRLDDKINGIMICTMQRLHQQDLAGVMIEEGGWEHLNLPATAIEDETIRLTRGRVYHRSSGGILHPARQPLKMLEQEANRMGSILYSAQYQQQPVPAEGNFIESAWLRHADMATLEGGGVVIQSWDTASKEGLQNDYSVCLTAIQRADMVYLIDVFRAKLSFPKLKREAIRLCEKYRPLVLLLENASSGIQLFQELTKGVVLPHVPRPILRKVKDAKTVRLQGISPMIEAGQLILPKEVVWLADFEYELLGFPNTRFDDQVDALSQMLEWVRARSWDVNVGAPPELIYSGPMETRFDDEYLLDDDEACDGRSG